jgi:hypothetical protein
LQIWILQANLYAPIEFPAGKHNVPAASTAFKANIRTQSNHFPFKTPTRVWLSQPKVFFEL